MGGRRGGFGRFAGGVIGMQVDAGRRNFGGGIGSARDTVASADLRRQINEDRTISDETRRELIGQIGERGSISRSSARGIMSTFNRARSGQDPLFKSRQVLQEQRNIQRDRPGRRQTLLGSFTNRTESQQ